MTPERCAEIYARAFAGTSRPWSATEFCALIDSPHGVFVHREQSFACARVIGDEAELLTIATDPAHQGKGHARACLRALHVECAAHGARMIYLEVAATNAAAIALYQGEGYAQTGTRRGYYTHGGVAVDALLMQKPLG